MAEYDLILAADVFVYVGDLSETFRLDITRRYSHALNYLQQLAAECGFVESSVQLADIRTQAGEAVRGWIVVLRKPGPSGVDGD